MSLFDDPVSWVEGAVGTRFKYLFISGVQVILGLIAIFFIQNTGHDHSLTFGILLFGIAFPCMYLYALKCLLNEYKKLKE